MQFVIDLEKAGPYVGPRGGLWADPKHTIHWDPAKHGTERLEAMLADLVPSPQVHDVARQLSKLTRPQIRKLLDDVKGKITGISERGEGVPVTMMRWQRILEYADKLNLQAPAAWQQTTKPPKPEPARDPFAPMEIVGQFQSMPGPKARTMLAGLPPEKVRQLADTLDEGISEASTMGDIPAHLKKWRVVMALAVGDAAEREQKTLKPTPAKSGPMDKVGQFQTRPPKDAAEVLDGMTGLQLDLLRDTLEEGMAEATAMEPRSVPGHLKEWHKELTAAIKRKKTPPKKPPPGKPEQLAFVLAPPTEKPNKAEEKPKPEKPKERELPSDYTAAKVGDTLKLKLVREPIYASSGTGKGKETEVTGKVTNVIDDGRMVIKTSQGRWIQLHAQQASAHSGKARYTVLGVENVTEAPPPSKPEKKTESEPGWERMPETEAATKAAEGEVGKRAAKKVINAGYMFVDQAPKNLAAAGLDAGLTRAQAKKLKDAGISVKPNPNAEPVKTEPTKPASTKAKPQRDRAPRQKKAKGKGDKLERTGDHIWGSRKDLAELELRSSKDLDDISFDDARHLVTKKRLVEVPELGEFAMRGQRPEVAHMALALLNSIGAKPLDHPDWQRNYLEEVREVQASIRQVKNLDDFRQLMREMRDKRDEFQRRQGFLRARKGGAVELVPNQPEDMSRAEALALVERLRKEQPHLQYTASYSYFDYKYHVYQTAILPYDSLGKRFQNFIDGKGKVFDDAFREASKISRMDTADEGYAHLQSRGLKKGEESKGPSKADREKRLRELGVDADTARGWSRAKEVAGTVERKGETVKVKDANPDRIKDTFNLKEVDFGESMSQADREYHAKALEGALHDMSEVLGVDPAVLSFQGRLGIALGARGRGKAAAHYEGGRGVINITRFRGGGAAAHEWGHALDNILGSMLITKGETISPTRYLFESHANPELPPKVKEAINRVHDAVMMAPDAAKSDASARAQVKKHADHLNSLITKSNDAVREINTIRRKPGSQDERKRLLEKAKANMATAKARAKGEKPDSHLHMVVERYQEGVAQLSDPSFVQTPEDKLRVIRLEGDVELLRGVINREKRFLSSLKKGARAGGASNFLRGALVISENYMAKPREMFARAFEAFVQDQLEDNGRRNSWLVDGTRAGGPKGEVGDTGFTAAAYPMGEERERINLAFKDLFRVLQEEQHLKKALLLFVLPLMKAMQ